MGSESEASGAGTFVEWLLRRELLRGPFPYLDYWASVMGLGAVVRRAHVREGLVDPALFRAALDRPDLELPGSRHYLLLFFLGPLLLPFRAFRRLGRRYRLRFRREIGREVVDALEPYRLRLEPAEAGRVRVESRDGRVLADGVLDPRRVAGFTSLFYPTYKLPLASLTAILAVAVLGPLLAALGGLDLMLRYWIPVGFPLLALLLYLVYRDAVTALLGALPVVFGRYLLAALRPGTLETWWPFFGSLAGLFLLYLAADWLFMPRPVPPVLLLYGCDGEAFPYEREEDAPGWLEGRAYWVWRYLLLTPAEIVKPWERDWERVELWVRADGERAGALEWVVTDAHYRELWIPYGRLAGGARGERGRREAIRAAETGPPGIWLVEVDADLLFHTPFVRAVTFVPEEEDVPVLGLRHLWRALWSGGPRDPTEPARRALDAVKVRSGVDVLEDIPEAVAGLAARHVLAQPWSRWRYPLGAHRRREPKLYDDPASEAPPPAADPALQVKAGLGAALRAPAPRPDSETEEKERGGGATP